MDEARRARLTDWLRAVTGDAALVIEGMALLSGGAIQQNWALDVSGGRAWVLRTDNAATLAVSHGRAQEYALRYAVVFSMQRADGSMAVPQQAVELSRDYLSPVVDSIGKASEREMLVVELRRDMAAAILRRVDAASKPAAAP